MDGAEADLFDRTAAACEGPTLELDQSFGVCTSHVPGSRRADAPATATIKDGLVTAGKTAHRWTDGARCSNVAR